MSGPFGSSQWMYNAGGGFYDFEISNSLRFNRADSAHLKFTPSSAGNRKTWTFSTWVKRSKVGAIQSFIDTRAAINATQLIHIAINNDDKLYIGSGAADLRTSTQLFRDTSAWYHFVCAFDSTNSTADNRIRLYVNGEEITSFSIKNNPSQNSDSGLNQTAQHCIGTLGTGTGNFLHGYLADTCLIEGTALTPASFGETKNDIWIPKDTSGLTFGNQGWRLQYKQVGTGTASSTTIGADTSGNDNHWTSTNLVASDVMPDSPTNNFATINIFDDKILSPHFTYSEGNLKLAYNKAGVSFDRVFGSMAIPPNTTNKYYMEFTGNVNNEQLQFGIVSTDSLDYSLADRDNGLSGVANASSLRWASYASAPHLLRVDSSTDGGGSALTTSNGNAANGDIFSILYDGATGKFFAWFKGTEFTNQSYPNTSLWATMDTSKTYMVMIYQGDGGTSTKTGNVTVNFGQDSSFAGAHTAQGNTDANGIGDFYYNVPANALALCTANLPDPVATIDPAQGGSPQDYFNTVLWTGNDADDRSISGVGFQPDWVWLKARNHNYNHYVLDSVRGDDAIIFPNLTNAEDTTDDTGFDSFDSDGFTISQVNGWEINDNAKTYVAWNWKAGTAFSNDASATGVGNTDSSGTVNTDAGFSIIKWTGVADGSTRNIAHGLGAVPKMIFVKNRERAVNWAVYHEGIGNTKALHLDTTSAAVTDASGWWASTTPTSTVFTTGHGSAYRTGGGGVTEDFIAYCFASVDGYSKVGSSYTGNGNADGPFVYTGFRPAFVMVKNASTTGSWRMYDTKRPDYNPEADTLYAEGNYAEDNTSSRIDILSNGFKITSAGTNNTSGATIIYMAFAEQSFKYANAR